MSIRTFAISALLALATIFSQAHAQTMTLTASGYIDYGNDDLNFFGTLPDTSGQRDLSGLAFTESITADINPAHWSETYVGPCTSTTGVVCGQGPSFTVTVTVNGHTVTYFPDSTVYGELTLNGAPTISMFGVNSNAQGVTVAAANGRDGMAFSVTSPLYVSIDPSTMFLGTPTRYTATISAVSEPASSTFAVMGLLFLGAVVSRRKSRS